jgi:hypothetical protein
MESVYHIVAIRVNKTSWAHVWRLRFRYLEMGFDTSPPSKRVTTVLFLGARCHRPLPQALPRYQALNSFVVDDGG